MNDIQILKKYDEAVSSFAAGLAAGVLDEHLEEQFREQYELFKSDRDALREKLERHKGCLHCQSGRPLTTDGGDAELVEIKPLPPINLTTGEEETAGDAYMALQISAFEGELRDYIPIRYCPMCGRKLSVSS